VGSFKSFQKALEQLQWLGAIESATQPKVLPLLLL